MDMEISKDEENEIKDILFECFKTQVNIIKESLNDVGHSTGYEDIINALDDQEDLFEYVVVDEYPFAFKKGVKVLYKDIL